MKRARSVRWMVLLLASALYGVAMLWVAGAVQDGLVGPSAIHRSQARALLEGRLSLADSITALNGGLAWHHGRVQQVWGLGVGLWLLPFEATWRLVGNGTLPDRVALGAAFALLAVYVGVAVLRLSRSGSVPRGIGLYWLVLVSPPLWTLARGARSVFEETELYGVLLAMGLLVSVMRASMWRERKDLAVCCVLGGISGFFRPTLLVYGLAGVAVCGWIFRHRRRAACIGIGGFLLGTGLLAMTNWQRFGSPTEFGHRLTVTGGSMVCLTRFENPYAPAGSLAAGRELFGLLFLADEVRDGGAFSASLFPGQAQEVRWRRLNMTVFDWSHLLFVFASGAGFVWWWLGGGAAPEEVRQTFPLFVWSLATSVGLSVFYLHYPVISSRYLLDYLPAFTGLLLFGWFNMAKRLPGVGLVVLAAWMLWGFSRARSPVSQTGDTVVELGDAHGISLERFGGVYTPQRHPGYTGIDWNGYGWEEGTGLAHNVVIAAVDRPLFVELVVEPRMNPETGTQDFCQAMIDGRALTLQDTEQVDGLTIVRLEVPEDIRGRGQDEVLFVCFSPTLNASNHQSQRVLKSIRWR